MYKCSKVLKYWMVRMAAHANLQISPVCVCVCDCMYLCAWTADWLTAWTWIRPRSMGRSTWMDWLCRREEGGGHWFVNREISILTKKERKGSNTHTHNGTRARSSFPNGATLGKFLHFSFIRPSLTFYSECNVKTIECNLKD